MPTTNCKKEARRVARQWLISRGHCSWSSDGLRPLALSVPPTRALACTCSCSHILLKCHEMLPGPDANSWPTTACPVCCQTAWQGFLQAGRANGFAYFGCSVITNDCPDLSSSGSMLVRIQAIVGPPCLGPPSSMLGVRGMCVWRGDGG